MKTNIKYMLGAAMMVSATLVSCSDFEPTGYEEVPNLPTATALKAEVSGHTINVSWQLPATSSEITDVLFIRDANTTNPVSLGANATSYQVKGQPMGVEGLFTVKICYDDRYVSRGVTTTCTLPVEELPGVSNLKASTSGRKVSLSWTNPTGPDVTGVRIVTNGDEAAAISLPAGTTSYTMVAQPMEVDLTYDVQAMYDEYYPSVSNTVKTRIPFITPKMGYLMTAASVAELPDDDERAAAAWFVQQPNSRLIYASDLATLDPDEVSVLWIEIDRLGLPYGWENLPAEISSPESIAALKAYSAAGGSLYLANMATQLTAPLGFVPDNMAPTIFGNGEGGSGNDVWVINPFLGVDFKDGSDQGYYDRSEHAIFKGITLEDPNGYGYLNIPLIGPGQREDHNCMWDCNIYGRGEYRDVIANFEATTGSLVLATWGHVRDHCVAGLVEFFATPAHGRCVANGFAAYEWNQNSGPNPYQANVEKLTSNILDYLK